MAAASIPPPVVGTSLTACSNANAGHYTQRVLQYVESLKDAEADRDGNKFSFTALG
jgi:hypothetical protein